ncbi:MAG: AAA family ATPase [Bacilli bacterium]|nr:AAA family ATPase [Bacilli bacterium]
MERLYLNKIIEWNENHRKPLMVYGARQIGKTYLIRDIFAKRFYKDNYIYVDFRQDDDMRKFVCGDGAGNKGTSDANKIIEYLSLRENRIIDKNTLLIFDEIQEALPAITSLKYFKQDFPEIPVIASGSMIRIKMRREQRLANQKVKEPFFFPVGAIETLYVYPVSFEEFLFNSNKSLYDAVNDAYENKTPLPDAVHNLAINAVYTYLLVGGMPEDVDMFLKGEHLVNVRKNMVSIFNDYLADMELYQSNGDSIVRSRAVFQSVYSQLNKESKNFRASLIDKRYHTREIKTPVDWLEMASVVYKSRQLKETVTLPLLEDNEGNFRLFMTDLGFLAYQSEINMSTFQNKEARNSLSGVFFENYVACELVAKGFPLFFWKGKNEAELEFVISDGENVIPLDVKKGRGSLNSLEKFKSHNRFAYAVKISQNNYGYNEDTKIVTIPFYMLFAYLNDLNKKKIAGVK